MRPQIRKSFCWIALSIIYWIAPSKICVGRSLTWQDSTAQVIEIRIDPVTAVGGLSSDTYTRIKKIAILYNLATPGLFNLKETKDSGSGLLITENSWTVLGIVKGALISDIPFLLLKKLYEEVTKSKKESLPQQLRELIRKDSHNPILSLSYLKH